MFGRIAPEIPPDPADRHRYARSSLKGPRSSAKAQISRAKPARSRFPLREYY